MTNAVETTKATCDFRLTNCYGKFNTIIWNDTGDHQNVSDAKLAKLQAAHSWTTDF